MPHRSSKFLRASGSTGIVPLAAVFAALGGALAFAPAAWADGAFPDGQAILLPRDRPRQIIVGTNFGLVFSEDDGATWAYSCEVAATATGRLYSVGAAPDHRLYAVSDVGAPVSVDDACTWTLGAGLLAGAQVLDVFPDPVDPLRVLAIARPLDAVGLEAAVFHSGDGGFRYDAILFEPPFDSEVTGVETSASTPGMVYVTFYQRPGVHPRLARSADGGATWTVMDLEPGLGAVMPYLVAVDPADAQTIILRLKTPALDPRPFEALAISRDGGESWSMPVMVAEGVLSAFLRRRDPSRTMFVAASVRGMPVGYRSDDGGHTFVDWPLALHVRGLAERGTAIFAATNDVVDGFAVGRSEDGGATWSPVLRFRDIGGVRACVREICQADCDNYAGLKLFPPETCNPLPDGGGGVDSNGGGNDAGKGGGRDGCSCALSPAVSEMADIGSGVPAIVLLVGLVFRSRSRSRAH